MHICRTGFSPALVFYRDAIHRHTILMRGVAIGSIHLFLRNVIRGEANQVG